MMSEKEDEPELDSDQNSGVEQHPAGIAASEDPIASEGGQSAEPAKLVRLAIIVEGALMLIAVVVGWFGFCASDQPLLEFDSATLSAAFVWGVIGTIPLLVLFVATLRIPFGIFNAMRQTIDQKLVPIFGKCTIVELLLISILAGLGEELLFRWCLQGGLSEAISMPGGAMIAVAISAIVFGFCHFLDWSYFIFTAVIGFYLGLLMVWSGTYLAPALAHGFYDFVALLYILKLASWKENSRIDE